MAILRGEEARQWLAQNPNKAYTDLTANVSVKRQPGKLEQLILNMSKPVRTFIPAAQELGYTINDLVRMAKGEQLTERPTSYLGMTEEESEAFKKDPLKQGLKAGASLTSYAMPAGAAKGVTGLKAVGQAAVRGVGSGALGGFGYSAEGEELGSTLKGGALGGLVGGALQGLGEGARALTKAKSEKVVNVLDVDEIAKLPQNTRSGLVKQAKSAGFWDAKLSESTNIQNFLRNRGFAGNTPAETLENLTQEFNRASQLKQEGLDEIGGLSRSYLRQVKDNLDEAITYKGIGLDSESTKVYNDIIKTLEKGPTGAKELDKIIMRWNEAGRLAKGAQKTTVAGLYADAARELRNVMRGTSSIYDSALQSLNQILGIEEVGTVSGAAKTAASAGLDLPLFSGAGFRGADIKTPGVSNVISQTQAAIGRAQETGLGGISPQLAQGVQKVTQAGQRAIPAVGALPSTRQEEVQTGVQTEGAPLGMYQQPQIELDRMALLQAVLSGQLSTSEADWIIEMLAPTSEDTPLLGTAINELERLYAPGTEQSLSRGKYTTGVGGLVSGAGTGLKKGFNQGYMDRLNAYNQQRALAVGIINQAREAGVLNEGEYQVMIENMPNEWTSEKVAKEWFDNTRRLLQGSPSNSSGIGSSTSALYQLLGLQ